MAETIAGYAHVNIVVTDVEAAKEFYGGKLGLELLPRPDFGGRFGGLWFRLGAAHRHPAQKQCEGCGRDEGLPPHAAAILSASMTALAKGWGASCGRLWPMPPSMRRCS